MQVLRFAKKSLAHAHLLPVQSFRMSDARGQDVFNYEFERKLHRGNFPHPHINYTKILDHELDTQSQ